MDFESEEFFYCPYCAQQISMLVEELYGAQTYIEDCEVCCNPIQISYEVVEGEVTNFNAERAL
jgi:hypothetical protein